MKRLLFSFLFVFSLSVGSAVAQREAKVNDEYVLELSDESDLTFKQAKQRCIELAKAKAIRKEFGEMITSDVIESNTEGAGKSSGTYFWENTVAQARGDWLDDLRQPEVNVEYADGKLIFTAKVWGLAREIIQARTELQWELLRKGSSDGPKGSTVSYGRGNNKYYYTRFSNGQLPEFTNGERVYLKFRAPSSGYVAVYLIEAADKTSCLLPYPASTDGRVEVVGGRDYLFFDKRLDSSSPFYNMETNRQSEDNQIVLIYSPHPFNKCNDVSKDALHPTTLNTHDFQKWLLNIQRHDREMVVNKRWIRILNPDAEK